MSDLVTRLIIKAGFMGEKPAEESAAALMREAVYEIGHLRARVAELEEGSEPVAFAKPGIVDAEGFGQVCRAKLHTYNTPLYAAPQPVKVPEVFEHLTNAWLGEPLDDSGSRDENGYNRYGCADDKGYARGQLSKAYEAMLTEREKPQ